MQAFGVSLMLNRSFDSTLSLILFIRERRLPCSIKKHIYVRSSYEERDVC